jgi:Zn finger protein HypA/HybF involved in hydrogenase expression
MPLRTNAVLTVWHYCMDCKRQSQGGQGQLCCPVCGGHVERIGSVERVRFADLVKAR